MQRLRRENKRKTRPCERRLFSPRGSHEPVRFVSAERANHAVVTLCRVVGISVSGFYVWLQAIPTHQHRIEAEAALRRRIFAAGRQIYGSPQVHAELHWERRRHSRRRIEQLMREMGLSYQRPYALTDFAQSRCDRTDAFWQSHQRIQASQQASTIVS